jgi:lysophospholipase L1-like esterase
MIPPPTINSPSPSASPTNPTFCASFPITAPMQYLALGDSYTIGESVPEADRWPVQLTAQLRAQGLDLQAPTLVARTGWTTDELSGALDTLRLAGPFDLVSLLIGVNNQYRGRDLDNYRAEFAALLQRAVGYANGRAARVFVLAIPDWGVMPFAEGRDRAQIAAQIDAFNAVNREETLHAQARYVDITALARRAATDLTLVAPDGLHPSGAMYAQWAQAALPVVCEMFRP